MLTLCRQVHMGFWCPHLCLYLHTNQRHHGWEGRSTTVFICRQHDYLCRVSDGIHQKVTKINQQVYQGCKINFKKSIVYHNEEPKQKLFKIPFIR